MQRVRWGEAKDIVLRDYPVQSLLHRSKYGAWCCPFCHSGEGPKGTGAMKLYEAENAVDCFGRCAAEGRKARRYDVIDVYRAVHSCGFSDALQSMADELGLEIIRADQGAEQETRQGDTIPASPVPAGQMRSADESVTLPAIPSVSEIQEPVSCRALYEKAENTLLNKPEGKSGRDYLDRRGLGIQEAERIHIGFVPDLDITGSGHPAPRLIIPMTDTGYFGIDVRADANPRYRRMNNRGGKVAPVGLDFLWTAEGQYVYICEGWADALSCMVGGRDAVALNSANNWRMLTDALKERPTGKTLLLCLDNDEAGDRAQKELAAELARMNISFVHVTSTICGDSKDPNEALCTDPAAFWSALEKAELQAAPRPDALDIYISGNWMAADIAEAQGRVLTGFKNFDDASGGLYNGLYVLGAITSLGKTTWALQMANSIARSGTHVIFFSLEMSRLEIASKSLVSRYAGDGGQREITSLGVRQGTYSLREIMDSGTLAAYLEDTAPRMNVVEGNLSCDVGFVCDYVRRYRVQNGAKPVVIVDYLQILEPGELVNKYQSTRESVDAVVKALKRLSREMSLPVLVISSLNRSNYMLPISEESFKESGGIEYSADCILGMELELIRSREFDGMTITEKREAVRRESNENPRKVSLVCLKNRYGRKSWDCRYRYYPACDYFMEAAGFETDMEEPPAGRRGKNGKKT